MIYRAAPERASDTHLPHLPHEGSVDALQVDKGKFIGPYYQIQRVIRIAIRTVLLGIKDVNP